MKSKHTEPVLRLLWAVLRHLDEILGLCVTRKPQMAVVDVRGRQWHLNNPRLL